jgi:hypothetical protein
VSRDDPNWTDAYTSRPVGSGRPASPRRASQAQRASRPRRARQGQRTAPQARPRRPEPWERRVAGSLARLKAAVRAGRPADVRRLEAELDRLMEER